MTPRSVDVPEETIQRMLAYLRELDCMWTERKEKFSSQSLAKALHVNPSQIRKDFSYFGEFGTRGVGYDTKQLIQELRTILNLDRTWRFALIGVGNIGSALLRNPELKRQGFEIVLAFDKDPRRIGKKIGPLTVEHVSHVAERIREEKVQLAIIATPVECAQETADKIIQAGIKGVLCFAPCHLRIPEEVRVVPIDIPMALGKLVYHMEV
jgi:redox-sensing transcriptional repressor